MEREEIKYMHSLHVGPTFSDVVLQSKSEREREREREKSNQIKQHHSTFWSLPNKWCPLDSLTMFILNDDALMVAKVVSDSVISLSQIKAVGLLGIASLNLKGFFIGYGLPKTFCVEKLPYHLRGIIGCG